MFKWLGSLVNEYVYKPLAYQANEIFEAQEQMAEFGIFPPAAPNRMDCAPSVNGMLEATVDSFKKGRTAIKAVEKISVDQVLRSVKIKAFSAVAVLGVGKKLLDDAAKAQACMDSQDEQRIKDMAEYEEQVLSLVEENRAQAIVPGMSLQQRKDDYMRVTNERGAKGQVGITWWEYNAMIDKGINPMSPYALDHIPRNELCPNGRYSPGSNVGRVEGWSEKVNSAYKSESDLAHDRGNSNYDDGSRDVERDNNDSWHTTEYDDHRTVTVCDDKYCGTADRDFNTDTIDSWGCTREEADNNNGHCPRP